MSDAPVPMLLSCPICHTRHVDAGEFAQKPHHTHACQSCGHVWRPALVATVGVQFLPGFKDAENLTLLAAAPELLALLSEYVDLDMGTGIRQRAAALIDRIQPPSQKT